ncbi:glycoside hydrolase family 57 protein [Fulvivirgaceae bacterium BMA12]|uniref:Glycoside hydrolase family 57 protein n=1 Tax=Agaribacillus aureus TaxID=3051825 RepID=A0ABT8LHE0_9BACT|nr:glycoside hydrolase family 57 protein [Fulvivirgaceae bacterium BMA12]
MKHICLYFQVHQPFRLRQISFFNITNKVPYFNDASNKQILLKVAKNCYLPTNKLFLELLKQYPFLKLSFSISGTAIDQFKKYAPQVIESFQALLETGSVELLSETNCHSLACVKGKAFFVNEVTAHRHKMKEVFAYEPKVFRNTELIYSNKVGSWVKSLGYEAMLTEGADKVLNGRSPNQLYHHSTDNNLKILLKNYRLSDDIAFRFSNRKWPHWPLTAEKFADWIHQLPDSEEIINLFMDYETFGEHQWKSTGIFEFLEDLPGSILKYKDHTFITPSEAVAKLKSRDSFSALTPISWADEERDLSAWLGNNMQLEAFDFLYALSKKVNRTNNDEMSRIWDYLQTSDHFYYMSTKTLDDGAVHAHFSPYNSPHQAFTNYMHVLMNFEYQLDKLLRR